MTPQSKVTALTDGARNCWSVVNALQEGCGELLKILDWFHIAKKFKEREYHIPPEVKELYNKAKWHLWHGRPITSMMRLEQVKTYILESEAIAKIDELIKYIKSNEAYIINYHFRNLKKLPYTTQLAESSVNTIINERQKNRKMQWSRAGAHNILQIRTSLFSKSWDLDWTIIADKIYKEAA